MRFQFKAHRSDDHFVSIMIIPPKGRKTISLRIPVLTISMSFAGILGLIAVIVFSIYYSSRHSLRASNYPKASANAVEQNQQIVQYHLELDEMKNQLSKLAEKEQEIRGLLSDSSDKKKSRWRITRVFDKFEDSLDRLPSYRRYTAATLEDKIDIMQTEIINLRQRYLELSRMIHQYRLQLASTPSIPPAYGKFSSGFGFRGHPVFGESIFHKGVDISGYTGSPLYATASGVVVHSGWYQYGYGLTVLIDHGYGFSTLYAHASRCLVNTGDFVRKGQVIALMGSTGLSTGPHVHYEVHRFGQPINPIRYFYRRVFTRN